MLSGRSDRVVSGVLHSHGCCEPAEVGKDVVFLETVGVREGASAAGVRTDEGVGGRGRVGH
jgi:hypothetical protein